MTGMPGLNYEAFNDMAKTLSESGYEVVNPVEVCKDLPREGILWIDYMRPNIKALVDCDAIFMLIGWGNSKGAQIERRLAEDLGMSVMYEDEGVRQ